VAYLTTVISKFKPKDTFVAIRDQAVFLVQSSSMCYQYIYIYIYIYIYRHTPTATSEQFFFNRHSITR
jgi:hypothetical protein